MALAVTSFASLADVRGTFTPQLDATESDTTLVLVESLDNYSRNEPVRYDTAAGEFGTIYMQVGAFGERNNAVRLADKVSAAGVPDVSVYSENGMFKVRIGPIADVNTYDAMATKVAALDVGKPHLVVEPR